MSLSSPFIRRPVGTTLLTIAIALAGILAYFRLPVSPLPEVEFPTIQVSAALPGASPETMASSVATPLERQFGRIAGVTEMTSQSALGSANITLQFALNRNIDAAGRDVQAAINAAAGQLPTNLPSKPNWRKINPADSPIYLLSLTSETYDKSRMYDIAASILQQKLSQIDGVGQVLIGGGANPAVRVEVNPYKLNNMGMSLEDVRTVLNSANANSPKGQITTQDLTYQVEANDQILKAKDYAPLVLTYKDGAAVRVKDIATVEDWVEDLHTTGLSNGRGAVLIILFKQPGANIIDTVDRVKAMLPELRAAIPRGIHLEEEIDRTITIRASVNDVQFTLLLSIGLVVLVVFAFLRDWRSTLIPSVAVPVSLVGTFGVMYLLGYTIDNLSLMAMTIATGFVVDDAIVVIENITRHLEEGMTPIDAALKGAKEIGFTVLSISVSLVAVFLPILMMGGIVGRLFREFAVVLSVAIGISLIVSLTTTPMMCATLLKRHRPEERGWLYRASERVFDWILWVYEVSLGWVLGRPWLMIGVTVGTVALTVLLFIAVPKTLFPQQDTGRLMGAVQGDQNISSTAMGDLMRKFVKIIGEDPAVERTVAFSGGQGGTSNTGRMFISLTDLDKRKLGVDDVIKRLRGKMSHVAGATVFLQAVQDFGVGGHRTNSQYQYNLQGDSIQELTEWAPKIVDRMRGLAGLADVNSDQQNKGLEATLTIDRDTASRLHVNPDLIDQTLYDAFGQRQVSTMYFPLTQYHVVMEVDDEFRSHPDVLKNVYVKSMTGTLVPLSALTRYETTTTPLAINHAAQFPAITISFNLLPGVSLSQAVEETQDLMRDMEIPATIHGSFAGTAQAFQASTANEKVLILAALATVYIVLGILYESLIHPITILSTLPSAGVGALLALMVCGSSLSIIAFIGIILLIGIVKKNAIMMIDFALEAERREGLSPHDAIYKASLLRFRPIVMTTMAAMLGGLPLAIGTGNGAELRQPLGIAIVGGLIFSQMLTLYTTPVIYLLMDRMRLWLKRLLTGSAEEHVPGVEHVTAH